MMSPILTRLTPLALALALSGCAIGPDYLRPANLLPSVFGEAKPADNVAIAQNPAINPEWWTLFNDKPLDDLVVQALQSNASLRQAIARVEQAEAVAREAGASFFPEIDGSAGISNSKASTKTATFVSSQPTVRHARSAGLSTSFELDVWGRIRRANESARASLLASQYSRDAVRLSVAGLVTDTYLALRAYDAQLAVSSETVKSREESLKLVKTRVDAGLASPLDGYQAEGALAAAQAQLTEQRRLRTLAEHQLALLTGNPELKIAAGDLKLLPLLPEPPAGLPSDLIEGRPDVRQAEQELIAANAGIGIAKAGYFPKFTLTGSIGSESKVLSDLFSAGSGTWSIGLAALMPILDFGRTSARVDQAKAVNQQSLIAWQNSLQTAYKEVRDALVSLREYGEEEGAQGIRVDRAEKAMAISRLRYEAGQTGYLEVLDAQRTLNDAQLAAISVRQARLSTSVSLFKALGGGWKADAPT
ncbi:efflux transporter outer membrane subunit [Dechloromonas sp. XY25]|uniref:Efflux transporter outer membrane subunit n=1 Tax=Dechloromonas hankyongensis TaxID=2908002 RepID=A0ABS9K2D5_9RHOO|nr:efflux transporter outer membrane subunit [Dechloromonas hankyongensis]MCG2577335.1 efflux transporter outer membrane subunit [Dechloromonas hankyongensis]